jgi:uncharacterized protein
MMLRKLATHFRSLCGKLLDLHDAPQSLAGGVAIGMFIGFTPLFGLKTILCLGLAYLLRCNPIAAVIAVSLHDIVTPLWPLLLEIEYQIGAWVLGLFGDHVTQPRDLKLHLHDFMKWTTFLGIGFPLLVGALFLSTPAAFISYWLTYPVFRRRQDKRASRSAPQDT